MTSNEEIKVNSRKILRTNPDNTFENDTLNTEVQVLQITQCNTLCEATKVLNKFILKNAPNIFIIQVEIASKSEYFNDLWYETIEIFPPDRALLLVRINEGKIFPFPKRSFQEGFNTVSHSIIENNRAEYTQLTSQLLCFILKKLDCSINDLNLSQILSSLNFKEPETLMKSAINSCDELCIRVMKMFDVKYSATLEKEFLEAVLKTRKLSCFLAFMDIFNETQINEEFIEKILKLNPNIYLDVVKYRNLEMLMVFNKFKQMFNLTAITLTELIDYSVEHEHFDVFNELKSHKNQQNLFLNGEKVLEEILKLHRMIQSGDFKGVKTFTSNNPNLKICSGLTGISALEKCIDCKKFRIFSFLRSKGFNTENQNQLDILIDKLDPDDKLQIRFENDKNATDDPQAYIGFLASKFKLDSLSKSNENFKDVREMLKDVSEINEIAASMRIAALTNIQMYFDLVCESIKDMNPVYRNKVFGIAFSEDEILYIGKDISVEHRHGTFAHEIMHFVLYLIFGNNCLPYCKWDDKMKKEWDEIVLKFYNLYRGKFEGKEKIVDLALRYQTAELRSLELIVRVVHVFALYRKNPKELEKFIENHAELVNFFRNRILPNLTTIFYKTISLNQEMKLFESINKSKFQIKMTNEMKFVNTSAKRILITSNLPHISFARLLNEIKETTTNKVEVNASNIYVDLDKLKQIQIKKKFDDLIRDENTERIIVNGNCEETLDFIKSLALFPDLQIFVIVDTENEKLLKILHGKFDTEINDNNTSWGDLSVESQEAIMEIEVKYKSQKFPLKELIEGNLSTEIMTLLSFQNDEVEVKEQDPIDLSFYIERKMQKKIGVEIKSHRFSPEKPIYQTFSLPDFIEDMKDKHIVLISDLAGSGKTTVMKKIHELSEEPYWIAIVDLKKHRKSLLDDLKIQKNFTNFIADEILKLNALEKLIFIKKYENNEAIILFDGFDEISPVCKENCIKIFENHQKVNKSQVWITTRTHLELDLEQKLKLWAHRIKPLDENEQINFFFQYWIRSNNDVNLVRACAELLVRKISKMKKGDSSIIGIMLPIRFLAVYYEKKLTSNFKVLIKTLNFIEIYEQLFRFSVNSEDKLGEHAIHDLYLIHEGTYETLALIHFLGRYHHLFGRSLNLELKLLEEFTRGGIIYYDTIDKIYFTHETYPEFLMAKFIFITMKSYDPKWQFANEFVDFYFKILNDKKFEITRMFLNCLIEINHNIFSSVISFKKDFSKKLVEKYEVPRSFFEKLFNLQPQIKGTLKFFKNVGNERLGDLFLFNMMMIRSENFDFYTKLIVTEIETKRQVWNSQLHAILLCTKEEEFVTYIQDICEYNIDSIAFPIANSYTPYHYLAEEFVPKETFLTFLKALKARESLISLFLCDMRSSYGCFFTYGIEVIEHDAEKVQSLAEILENYSSKDNQKAVLRFENRFKRNALQSAVTKNPKIFSVVLDCVARIFDNKNEFKMFLMSKTSEMDSVFNLITSQNLNEHLEILNKKIREKLVEKDEIDEFYNQLKPTIK